MNRGGFGSLQEDKVDSSTSAMDIFEPEVVDKAVRHSRECVIRPTSMQSAGPFIFQIPAENDLYVDTKTLRLHGKVKLKRKTTTGLVNLDETDLVTVANAFPKGAFKMIETYLNGVPLGNPSTPAYPYRSIMESLLSFTETAKKTHLECEYFKPDLPGHCEFDDYMIEQGTSMKEKAKTHPQANCAGYERYEKFAKSNQVDFSDTLRGEVSTFDRFLLNKVDIMFKFIRSDDSFFIQQKDESKEYVLHFDDLYMTVNKIELDEDFVEGVNSKLAGGKRGIYPISRSTVRTKQVANSLNYLNWSGMYQGKLPETIIIGMVDSKAFAGSKTLNPFNFQHFDMKNIQLKVNSVSVPSIRLDTVFNDADKTKRQLMRAYRHLNDHTGILSANDGTGITLDMFAEGFSLFPFDLSPDLCLSHHNHLAQTGQIDLEISFGTDLPQNITIVALMNYNDTIEIDHERKIYVNASLNA